MADTKGSRSHTAARKAAKHTKDTKKTSAQENATSSYSPEAGEYVKEEMNEMKQGKLESGHSGNKVRNPKQAIAIGLSEARKAGKKVPPAPGRKAA